VAAELLRNQQFGRENAQAGRRRFGTTPASSLRMSIEYFWRLPAASDARYGDAVGRRRGERAASNSFTAGVSDPRGDRFNYLDYLRQVARAADLTGFDGIHVGNDPNGDESWIVAGHVARATRRVRLLTEFDASRGSAVYAAKNAASYQRYTGGRFAWQIGRGGTGAERRRQADFAEDADISPRIEEFVTVARGVLSQAPFSFKGRYFEVLDGGFRGPLSNQAPPPVYLSGGTEDAHRLSARIADVHVFDPLPVEQLRSDVDRLTALARGQSRVLRFGLRLDIIARETGAEADFDARRRFEQGGASSDSSSVGRSLVGSYAEVIGRLVEYVDAGVSSFILAGAPHLEEAYRIGEHILPAVRGRHT
jgi:alkanesulfonate monooxygenase